MAELEFNWGEGTLGGFSSNVPTGEQLGIGDVVTYGDGHVGVVNNVDKDWLFVLGNPKGYRTQQCRRANFSDHMMAFHPDRVFSTVGTTLASYYVKRASIQLLMEVRRQRALLLTPFGGLTPMEEVLEVIDSEVEVFSIKKIRIQYRLNDFFVVEYEKGLYNVITYLRTFPDRYRLTYDQYRARVADYMNHIGER